MLGVFCSTSGGQKANKNEKNTAKFTLTSWFGRGFAKVVSRSFRELSANLVFHRLLGHPKLFTLRFSNGFSTKRTHVASCATHLE